MKKYLLSILVICECAFVTAVANAATAFYPYDSNSQRENVPLSATVLPRKKIVVVDRVNTVTRNFSQGCAAGTVAIGISNMPKIPGNFTMSTPISHNKYKFDMRDDEWACTTWVYYWKEYVSWNPTWVTSLRQPKIICAPIKLVWSTVVPPADATNEIPSGDDGGTGSPGTGEGSAETDE